MNTITNIALSNDKKNKTRSILIIFAIVLTTTLLTIISTFANGMINLQKEGAADTYGSYYGVFQYLNNSELKEVKRRAELSDIGLMCSAGIIEGNEKGRFVSIDETALEMMPNSKEYLFESGIYPVDTNEIAASKAFFESEGYRDVKVGDTVSISYRLGMSDEYAPNNFVVSGILQNSENYKADESYIVFCSKAFYENQIKEENRHYNVYFRLNDTVDVSMNNIENVLTAIAKDCGIESNKVNINSYYLTWILDPSYEMLAVSGTIALCVVLFSIVVIYNIFQVGIIQKIQEYGKIKALGATRKQMRSLIFREGMILAIIAIPIGLIIGFIVTKISFSWLIEQSNALVGVRNSAEVPLFSLSMIIISALISFATVALALRKPMKIVSNISPVEATRYQESSNKKQRSIRKGRKEINVFSLALANITGNKKRTLGTIFTMGLSCVLFVVISNYVGNIDTVYETRKGINHGQFQIKLDYSMDDKAYPENNLDSILKDNPLNEELISKIKDIPGVTEVLNRDVLVAEVGESKNAVSILNREDFQRLCSDADIGNMNYDEAVKDGNIFFGWAVWMEEDGYALNKPMTLQLDNGVERNTYNGTIAGSFGCAYTSWVLPEDVYKNLQPTAPSIGYIWVDCEEEDILHVEQELKNLIGSTNHIEFKTYHDELETSEFSSRMMKMGCYLFMAIVGLIGFMNLANTMIISITTKKQEYGVLQAVGMTNKQLNLSLQIQGMLFTIGTITVALAVGLPLGYALFSYAKNNAIFGINEYHVPIIPILCMILVITILQLILSFVLSHNLKKESLVERIRYQG